MRQAFMILASLVILPVSAAAAGNDQQGAKPPDTKPGVVVEKVDNGVVGGPDVKYTQVNGHDGVLVGGFGGVLCDKTLFIGGAGYWLANGDWDRELSYGGVLVQWYLFSRRTIAVSVGGLVGGGWGTAKYQWADGAIPDPYPTPRHPNGGYYPPGHGIMGGYGAYEAGFFVGEPQVNLVWHAVGWISVSAGIGYRAVAGAGSLDQEFRGATGSVAVRFGSPSK